MALKDSWRIDPKTTAFVTVDMQRAYLEPGSPRECVGAREFVHKINELAAKCRLLGIPVIHLRNFFRRDLSDMGLIPEIRAQTDSEFEATEGKKGVEFCKDMDIQHSDRVINKIRNSAFIPGSSNLESVLRGLKRDSLIICGVATDVCVASTVIDGMMLGFKIFLVGDLTATMSEERERVALEVLNKHFARVISFEQLHRELNELSGTSEATGS